MTLKLYLEGNLALSLIAAGAYFGAASLLWKGMGQTASQNTKTWALCLWGLALIIHAVTLFSLLYSSRGLDMAFLKSASLVAWIIALFLLLSCLRHRLEILAFFILPATAVLLLSAYFSATRHFVADSNSLGVQVHIVLSLLAYSLLSFGAFQALALAWHDHQLRKNPSHFLIARLPSLEAMEAFLFILINSGFILLSAGIVSGWLYHEDLMAQHLAHKTVFSIIAWLIFAWLIVGRLLYGWRGRRVLRLTIAGVSFLVLAYFGSKLVLEYILHRV